jgi:DNA mismatch repair protein MutS
MPPALIQRANELLAQLEQMHGKDHLGERITPAVASSKMQLSIFDAHTETFEEIRKKLEGLDINRLTPVEALLKLNEIKNLLK